MYFGKTLNSQTIYIDLQNTYLGFVIDVWVYPDIRLSAITTNDVLFMTDNHRVQYTLPYNSINVKYTGLTTTYATSINTNDNFKPTTWNHLMIYADYYPGRTDFYVTFGNNVYPGPRNNAFKTYGSSAPLSKIYFCNRDMGYYAACDVDWADVYYKNLKVWDGQYTNYFAAMQYFQ